MQYLPFKLDLYAIHGNRLSLVKKKLCKSLFYQLFLSVILTINIYFIEVHFQKPTESIYLTYKYWWMAANCYQLVLRMRHILLAIIVMCKPDIAMNKGFLICNKVIHLIDKYVLFNIFVYSVFILYLLNYYVFENMELYSHVTFYKNQPPTFIEHFLSAIIHFQIGIVIIILI